MEYEQSTHTMIGVRDSGLLASSVRLILLSSGVSTGYLGFLLEAIVVSPFVHGGYRVPKCLARQLEHQTDFPFIRISRI